LGTAEKPCRHGFEEAFSLRERAFFRHFAGQNPQNRGVFPKIEGNLSTLDREQVRMCVLCLNCSDKQKSY
jgi:hypothetical protein